MRILPRNWNYETLVCGTRGHVTPARTVRQIRPGDRTLGLQCDDGSRFARCVRCDAWVQVPAEQAGTGPAEHLPELEDLELPVSGAALEDAVVVRVIAVIRGFHSLAFTVLAVGLGLVMTNLTRVKQVGDDLRRTMEVAVAHTGQQASRSFVTDVLGDIDALHPRALEVLFATAVAYAVLEGVEAVGLWRQRRWAEYLTVIATAGFLPFEISALFDKVTAPRLAALVVNLAILAWLVWSKRLFGVRGGSASLAARDRADARRRIAALRQG